MTVHTRLLRMFRLACDLLDGIGSFSNIMSLGAKGQIQGIHPSPTTLSLILLSVDFQLQSLHYWAVD